MFGRREDLRRFILVAELGSLSAAAEADKRALERTHAGG